MYLIGLDDRVSVDVDGVIIRRWRGRQRDWRRRGIHSYRHLWGHIRICTRNTCIIYAKFESQIDQELARKKTFSVAVTKVQWIHNASIDSVFYYGQQNRQLDPYLRAVESTLIITEQRTQYQNDKSYHAARRLGSAARHGSHRSPSAANGSSPDASASPLDANASPPNAPTSAVCCYHFVDVLQTNVNTLAQQINRKLSTCARVRMTSRVYANTVMYNLILMLTPASITAINCLVVSTKRYVRKFSGVTCIHT